MENQPGSQEPTPQKETKNTERRIAPAKIAELKKKTHPLLLVEFTVIDDEGAEHLHEALFTKPSPLAMKLYTNTMTMKEDMYGASVNLVLETLIHPSKEVVRILLVNYPALAIQLNGEIQPLIQRVKGISSKNV